MLEEDVSSYKRLESASKQLADGFEQNIRELGLPLTVNRVGSMMTLFFTPDRVTNYRRAAASDTEKFAAYFRSMLEQHMYFPPSQYEAAFVSIAHSEEDIARTVEANRNALRDVFA